jgi:hypothetical protein
MCWTEAKTILFFVLVDLKILYHISIRNQMASSNVPKIRVPTLANPRPTLAFPNQSNPPMTFQAPSSSQAVYQQPSCATTLRIHHNPPNIEQLSIPPSSFIFYLQSSSCGSHISPIRPPWTLVISCESRRGALGSSAKLCLEGRMRDDG